MQRWATNDPLAQSPLAFADVHNRAAARLALPAAIRYYACMTLDECLSKLRSPDPDSDQTLRAAVALADGLAPHIDAITQRFIRGSFLLPGEHELLFNGLHILAAARHPDLLDLVLAVMRRPREELEALFAYRTGDTLGRLLVTVWNRDPGELQRLIELADVGAEVRWALYDVLARLTFDGRIPRTETAAFLRRIADERPLDAEDPAWWGWEKAVTRLGLVELEPELRRIRELPAFEGRDDLQVVLGEMHRAAAAPAEPIGFTPSAVQVIDDPAEATAWIREAAREIIAEMRREGMDEIPPPDDDPAKDGRLRPDEESWLAGFLFSCHVPNTAMSLEMLDGFFTALALAPVPVAPGPHLHAVWDLEKGRAPDFDGAEQAAFVASLIERHWQAIVTRRNADAPHVPLIDDLDDQGDAADEVGEGWATGFLDGVDVLGDAWQAFFDHERASGHLMLIEALSGESSRPTLTADEREQIVANLPEILRRMARFWRDGDAAFPRREPVRVVKVGRNDPCPCGSGKKFKKCCGSASGSTLH